MTETKTRWMRGIAVTLICFMVTAGFAAVLPILLLSVWDVPEMAGGFLGQIVKTAVWIVSILLFLVLLHQSIGICERAFGRNHPEAGKFVGNKPQVLWCAMFAITYGVIKIMVAGLHTITGWSFFEDTSGSLSIALLFALIFGVSSLQEKWSLVRRSDAERDGNNQ